MPRRRIQKKRQGIKKAGKSSENKLRDLKKKYIKKKKQKPQSITVLNE